MKINDININHECYNELAEDYLVSGLIGHIDFKDYLNYRVKKEYQNTDIDGIKNAVCAYFGIEKQAIETVTRKRAIVQSRQLVMKMAKDYTRNSLSVIGQEIGNKDHSTVSHACKTINNLIETDKVFRGQVQDIKKILCVR